MSLSGVERAIKRVRTHIREYLRDRPEGPVNGAAPANNVEMSTRYIVIDPVLRSLGWDLSDPSQCVVEKIAGQKRRRDPYPRVDYVLLGRDGKVAALVEAKRIRVSMQSPSEDNQKAWENGHGQLLGYLNHLRVPQVGVLTNGHEWKVFLREDGRWLSDDEVILLGSGPVRPSACWLLHYLGREHCW